MNNVYLTKTIFNIVELRYITQFGLQLRRFDMEYIVRDHWVGIRNGSAAIDLGLTLVEVKVLDSSAA